MKIKVNILFFLRNELVNYMLNSYLPNLKNPKITCNSLSDGAGAVFLRIYTAIIYSHKIGGHYFHTPISSLEHNYYNDVEYVSKWEKYFGFLSNYSKIKQTDIIVSIDSFKQIFFYFIYYKFLYAKKIIFKFKFHHPAYINLNPSDFISLNQSLKNCIISNNEKLKNNGKLNIIIHIRRGDVSIDKNYNRFTHNQDINSKIIELKYILDDLELRYNFHLISQGSIKDFKNISNIDYYHLGLDPIADFDKMVNADILLTSKSSFSYLSAVFCSGLVIYEEFWLFPLDKWLTINQKSNLYNYLRKFRFSNV